MWNWGGKKTSDADSTRRPACVQCSLNVVKGKGREEKREEARVFTFRNQADKTLISRPIGEDYSPLCLVVTRGSAMCTRPILFFLPSFLRLSSLLHEKKWTTSARAREKRSLFSPLLRRVVVVVGRDIRILQQLQLLAVVASSYSYITPFQLTDLSPDGCWCCSGCGTMASFRVCVSLRYTVRYLSCKEIERTDNLKDLCRCESKLTTTTTTTTTTTMAVGDGVGSSGEEQKQGAEPSCCCCYCYKAQ